MAAVALIVAWHDPGARRWLVGAVAAMVVAGLVWLAVIWLPNRSAVSLDLKIWAPVRFSITPVEAIKDAGRYILTDNDKLFGLLLGPLVLLGGVGLALVAAFHRRLSRAQARLALVSIGWVIFGFGVLLIASYRPNRYVVPIVPPWQSWPPWACTCSCNGRRTSQAVGLRGAPAAIRRPMPTPQCRAPARGRWRPGWWRPFWSWP